MCIYIYTRFCSQLILELLSVESIRARQLCTNDSITGRDDLSKSLGPRFVRFVSFSLSLFVRVYQPRFYLGRSISLFFLFFLLPIFYISLPPSPLCFAFPPSLPPFRSSLPRLLFILPTSSALLSRSRTAKEGGWRLVGGNWEGRSRKTWMDEKRRGEGKW